MDWIEKLNEALDYIEANLDGEIDVGLAAKKALCSSFHFQRMFTYIAGQTLGEYIRRRRMTLPRSSWAIRTSRSSIWR